MPGELGRIGGYHTSSSISRAPSPSGQEGTYLINTNNTIESPSSTGGGRYPHYRQMGLFSCQYTSIMIVPRSGNVTCAVSGHLYLSSTLSKFYKMFQSALSENHLL